MQTCAAWCHDSNMTIRREMIYNKYNRYVRGLLATYKSISADDFVWKEPIIFLDKHLVIFRLFATMSRSSRKFWKYEQSQYLPVSQYVKRFTSNI